MNTGEKFRSANPLCFERILMEILEDCVLFFHLSSSVNKVIKSDLNFQSFASSSYKHRANNFILGVSYTFNNILKIKILKIHIFAFI